MHETLLKDVVKELEGMKKHAGDLADMLSDDWRHSITKSALAISLLGSLGLLFYFFYRLGSRNGKIQRAMTSKEVITWLGCAAMLLILLGFLAISDNLEKNIAQTIVSAMLGFLFGRHMGATSSGEGGTQTPR
jgi:hypothetical protein